MLSRNRRCPSWNTVSKAKLDLPEPEGPVTTVNLPIGISQSTAWRLCVRAPLTEMLVGAGSRVVFLRGLAFAFFLRRLVPSPLARRAAPVCDASMSAACSGVPQATSWPPPTPPLPPPLSGRRFPAGDLAQRARRVWLLPVPYTLLTLPTTYTV